MTGDCHAPFWGSPGVTPPGHPTLDKDEAAGSSPARPTKWFLTSGDAGYLSWDPGSSDASDQGMRCSEVPGARACITDLTSTFPGRLPFALVARSAAQRSENA